MKSTSIKKLGWVICILAAIFYCYEYLLRIAPAAMVSELREAFQLDATAFGVLISLYYLIYTPMQAVVGVAHDLYGPRRMLTLAVFTCALGSLLFGIATTTEIAAFGRLLMGFGSAFAFVGAMKLASVWLPLNRFAMFAGFIAALGMSGGMFGNIFMTSFVQHVGWQETYFLGAIVGAILMFVVWFVIKDVPKHIAASSQKNSYRETFQGLYLMIKNPQTWIAGIVACGFYLSLSAFGELWGNDFIETAYGFSKSDAATLNSALFLGWVVGAPLTGWISDFIRLRRLPLLICAVGSLICSVLIVTLNHPSFWIAATVMFLYGIFSSSQVICFAVGRENTHHRLAGSAVAFVNLLIMAGGLITQPLVGKLLDYFWSGQFMTDGIRAYSAGDFKSAMIVLPIGCLITLICLFFMRETHAEMRV